MLDEKFKQAKENEKAAEEQGAVFRAEQIQVKKEKSKIGAKLKMFKLRQFLPSKIKPTPAHQ